MSIKKVNKKVKEIKETINWGINKTINSDKSRGVQKSEWILWGAGINESSNIELCQAINESSYTYCCNAIDNAKHIIHSSAIFNSEYIRLSSAVLSSSYVIDSQAIKNSKFITYSEALFNCMFCYKIKNKEFYIFNKKYSKKEYFKHLNKIEAIISKNEKWKPFELYRTWNRKIKFDYEDEGFLKKKAKEFPPELLRYIKKNFVKSAKEEKIFERIFDYKIGDCK